MKRNLISFLCILSCVSCKANDNAKNIEGKWRVVDIMNIISVDKDDWKKYKSLCLGGAVSIVLTGGKMTLRISNGCDQDGDFKKCDTILITHPVAIKVKADQDTLDKYPDIKFYSDSGYVNQTFLNTVRGNHKVDVLKGYNTNCSISWGDETLKIISVTKDRLVFYVYSYMLILERE